MSQHDYTIANQGFPATRADINNALSAIATNNSGTSAPSTQYAGQFWIDTTSSTWTMYIHDGTDDIQFATIDTSTNTVNFIDSALASDVVINTSGAITTTGAFTSVGIDDNATSTAITIDSSENVGIGTGSPTAKLHVDVSNSGVTLNSEADDFFVESSSNTGITIGSGTGSRSSIYFANSSDNDIARIVVSHAEGSMRFTNNASERMRIEASGNVAIGTTTTQAKLHIVTNDVGALNDSNADEFMLEGTNAGLTIGSSTTGEGAIHFSDSDDADVGKIQYAHSSNLMTFRTNGANRMFIDSSGNVLINTTSVLGSGYLHIEGQGKTYCAVMDSDSVSGGFIGFEYNNVQVGSITTNGTTTAYVTSSDYRLKENVNYDFDATTRLKQLKPARFNFIADADTTVDGFLAHEVSDIVPEAITGTKDETETKEKVVINANGGVIAENIEQADWEAGKIPDENGNTKYPTDSTWEATKVVPVYQGIDQAKLVPLLVKTIQELEARITALETTN